MPTWGQDLMALKPPSERLAGCSRERPFRDALADRPVVPEWRTSLVKLHVNGEDAVMAVGGDGQDAEGTLGERGGAPTGSKPPTSWPL
jgi:hypothetical protein